MDYDLDNGSPTLNSAEVFEEIKEFYDMNTYRGKSEIWAFKDIKFLIYDDTDDCKEPNKPQDAGGSNACGYDSNDEDGMLQYALELSRQTENMDSGQPAASSSSDPGVKPGPKRITKESWTQNHQSSGSCPVCCSLPEFPHNPKPRKLRLFSPKEVMPIDTLLKASTCHHYVPVSYCWPSRPKDKDGNPVLVEGTYRIRELDGTLRPNRAADEVIDRAIDFAQTCGLRMVWIDQECLPQEDNEEREISLQAMDIVYGRAITTAGLHSTVISDLCQPRAIEQLLQHFQALRQGKLTWDTICYSNLASLIPLALDFIDNVRKEKWYTRAWIAQEAVSSAGKICLVFRLTPGVTSDHQIRFPGRFQLPTPCLDKESPFKSTQWALPSSDFRYLMDGITEFYRIRKDAGGSPSLLALKPHAVSLLEAATDLWPSMPKGNSPPIYIIHGPSYGFRMRLNAAGALTLFRNRYCTRPHDRLAIMANLCGYDIRLDTRRVKARGGSLRVALLALATLNSDLSLFVPELYQPLPVHGLPSNSPSSLKPWPERKLIQPFDSTCSLDYHVPDLGYRRRPRSVGHLGVHDVRRQGISLPSYIWTVDDTIDLKILKYQWEDRWRSLKASQVAAGVKVDVNSSLSPVFVEMEEKREVRRQVVEIILSILKYLHDISKHDARAQGVANSIWQSIHPGVVKQRDYPSKDAKMPELPDIPGPDLFQHPLVQTYSWGILQLDHSPDGMSYNQLWFIERIFSNGALWVGCYTHVMQPQFNDDLRRAMKSEVTGSALRSQEVRNALTSYSFVESMKSGDIPKLLQSEEACEALESDEARDFLRSEEVRNMLKSEETRNLLYWSDLHDHLRYEKALDEARSDLERPPRLRNEAQPSPTYFKYPGPRSSEGAFDSAGSLASPVEESNHPLRTIMGRQLGLEMLATMAEANVESFDGDNWDPAISRNHMALLAILAYRIEEGTWGLPEAEVKRVLKLFSVFDVQAPCTVATPFDPDIELLPRSDIRSLSTCWLVEQVMDEMIPQGQNTANGKKRSSGLIGTQFGENAGYGNRGTCLYQVEDKIKGLWEIMDLPEYAHYFI